jgi:hypothetical protein
MDETFLWDFCAKPPPAPQRPSPRTEVRPRKHHSLQSPKSLSSHRNRPLPLPRRRRLLDPRGEPPQGKPPSRNSPRAHPLPVIPCPNQRLNLRRSEPRQRLPRPGRVDSASMHRAAARAAKPFPTPLSREALLQFRSFEAPTRFPAFHRRINLNPKSRPLLQKGRLCNQKVSFPSSGNASRRAPQGPPQFDPRRFQ